MNYASTNRDPDNDYSDMTNEDAVDMVCGKVASAPASVKQDELSDDASHRADLDAYEASAERQPERGADGIQWNGLPDEDKWTLLKDESARCEALKAEVKTLREALEFVENKLSIIDNKRVFEPSDWFTISDIVEAIHSTLNK